MRLKLQLQSVMFDYIEFKLLLTSFAIKLYLITLNYFQLDWTSFAFLHVELLLITMNQLIWLIFITFNYIELL